MGWLSEPVLQFKCRETQRPSDRLQTRNYSEQAQPGAWLTSPHSVPVG